MHPDKVNFYYNNSDMHLEQEPFQLPATAKSVMDICSATLYRSGTGIELKLALMYHDQQPLPAPVAMSFRGRDNIDSMLGEMGLENYIEHLDGIGQDLRALLDLRPDPVTVTMTHLLQGCKVVSFYDPAHVMREHRAVVVNPDYVSHIANCPDGRSQCYGFPDA